MQVLNGVDAGERKARVLVIQKVTAKHASARHRVSVQDDDLAVLCLAARGLAVLQGARSFANASIQVVLAAYSHFGIAFANLVGIQ